MDWLVPIWRHVNSASRHYWVVEGNIWACFDNVHHRILVGSLRKRIADRDVVELIEAFLKASVMEGRLFKRTEIGISQGSIRAPLLANVYFHQIFGWPRKKYGRPLWRVIRAKQRHRDPRGRINFVCQLRDSSPIWLYRMSDRPIRRYWINWHRPTYAEEGTSTDIEDHPDNMKMSIGALIAQSLRQFSSRGTSAKRNRHTSGREKSLALRLRGVKITEIGTGQGP